jgi:CBS domain-containing protein
MTVEDVMRTDVVTAGPDAAVASLTEIMRDENVGSVVVVENDTPVGLVTDRDLALRAVNSLSGTTARDVMTPDPITVAADTSVFEATALVGDVGVRRLPVTEEGRLVGIVTLDDLVRLLVVELDNLTDVISAESPPY